MIISTEKQNYLASRNEKWNKETPRKAEKKVKISRKDFKFMKEGKKDSRKKSKHDRTRQGY